MAGIAILVLCPVGLTHSLGLKLLGLALQINNDGMRLVKVTGRGQKTRVFRRARHTMPKAFDWLGQIGIGVLRIIVW